MDVILPGSMISIEGGYNADTIELGEGVYVADGSVYASRAGTLQIISPGGQKTQLSVITTQNAGQSAAPQIGNIIVGTVTKVTSRYIGVEIRVVERAGSTGAIFLEEPWKGTLRSQDIWPAEEKEAPLTQLYLASRPGDLIRAKIIGVGDTSAGFLISTAIGEEYGVVFAKCAASGLPMLPLSWNEMICPQSGIKESRKPARPKASN